VAAVVSSEAELLRDDFLDTARWRREKAKEHPDDERNLRAAELLEELATSVDAVAPELLEAYMELGDDIRDSEIHSDMLRTIGFHWAPASGTEFVRAFIARVTGGPVGLWP
jgi:hypothetical protein